MPKPKNQSAAPPTMDPTGPLTAETYLNAARKRIAARKAIYGEEAACVMLDPTNEADHHAWAAWRQFFQRLASEARPIKIPRFGGLEQVPWRPKGAIAQMDRSAAAGEPYAVPAAAPWELTGELPYSPFASHYPQPMPREHGADLTPEQRRTLATELRRAASAIRARSIDYTRPAGRALSAAAGPRAALDSPED